MIKTFNYLFVTFFGIGTIRFAPGTITSLITTVLLFSLFHILNLSNNVILLFLIMVFLYCPFLFFDKMYPNNDIEIIPPKRLNNIPYNIQIPGSSMTDVSSNNGVLITFEDASGSNVSGLSNSMVTSLLCK